MIIISQSPIYTYEAIRTKQCRNKYLQIWFWTSLDIRYYTWNWLSFSSFIAISKSAFYSLLLSRSDSLIYCTIPKWWGIMGEIVESPGDSGGNREELSYKQRRLKLSLKSGKQDSIWEISWTILPNSLGYKRGSKV